MHGCSYELTRAAFIAKYRLTAEQKHLCEKNYPLAFWVALRYFKAFRRIGQDEIDSMALDGLVKAARMWNPTRGVKFVTYATWVILRCVQRDIRQLGHFIRLPEAVFAKGKKAECEALLDRTRVYSTATFPTNSWEPAAVDNPPEFGPDEVAGLERALRCLPRRAREIIQLRSEGRTLKEVGKRYGVTREAVRQIEGKALERLRRYFGVMDGDGTE